MVRRSARDSPHDTSQPELYGQFQATPNIRFVVRTHLCGQKKETALAPGKRGSSSPTGDSDLLGDSETKSIRHGSKPGKHSRSAILTALFIKKSGLIKCPGMAISLDTNRVASCAI